MTPRCHGQGTPPPTPPAPCVRNPEPRGWEAALGGRGLSQETAGGRHSRGTPRQAPPAHTLPPQGSLSRPSPHCPRLTVSERSGFRLSLRNRKATTGMTQTAVVSVMVSHTVGCARVFWALPGEASSRWPRGHPETRAGPLSLRSPHCSPLCCRTFPHCPPLLAEPPGKPPWDYQSLGQADSSPLCRLLCANVTFSRRLL